MLVVVEKLTSNHLSRELLTPLHRTLMLIDSIRIIASFTLDPCILCEKVLIQLDFMHKYLLLELIYVIYKQRWLNGSAL